MKFDFSQKIVAVCFVLAFTLMFFSCQPAAQQVGGAQTPTESYKMLYAAVKSKDIEKIKKMMSKNSLDFAAAVAAQKNEPVEKVLENGYTATTFAAALPQIRDERVNAEFGALEVWNEKQREWEDLPFVKEEDGWKMAVGDLFKGSYQSPGKSKSMQEREAANLANPNSGMIQMPNVNVNSATNVNTIPMKKIQLPEQPASKDAANGATKK